LHHLQAPTVVGIGIAASAWPEELAHLFNFLFLTVVVLLLAISRISAIGRRATATASQAGFALLPVPEPTPNWISLASIVSTFAEKHLPDIQKSLASALPGVDTSINTMLVQDSLIQNATLSLVQEIQNAPEESIGVEIDYDHVNALTFRLASDGSTNKLTGFDRPEKSAFLDTSNDDSPLYLHPKNNKKHHIVAIRINKWCSRGMIWIAGLKVHRIVLGEDFSSKLSLLNCWRNQLTLKSNSSLQNGTIRFSGLHIDKLTIAPNSFRDLFIPDTYINLIECAPPEFGNPVLGSIVLSGDVRLSGSSLKEENIQDYRNLRYNLDNRRENRLIHIIRAIELRAERKYYDSRLLKIVNYLYEMSSGFGNVPERALAVLAALVAYNVLLIWVNRLHTIALDCSDPLASCWLVGLCHDGVWSALLASILLALHGFLRACPKRG
jgi:hypothetical protein